MRVRKKKLIGSDTFGIIGKSQSPIKAYQNLIKPRSQDSSERLDVNGMKFGDIFCGDSVENAGRSGHTSERHRDKMTIEKIKELEPIRKTSENFSKIPFEHLDSATKDFQQRKLKVKAKEAMQYRLVRNNQAFGLKSVMKRKSGTRLRSFFQGTKVMGSPIRISNRTKIEGAQAYFSEPKITIKANIALKPLTNLNWKLGMIV
jgi:hypothetical protein